MRAWWSGGGGLPGLLLTLAVALWTWCPGAHIVHAEVGKGREKVFSDGSKVFHTKEKESGFIDYVKHKTWSRILFSSSRANEKVHMEWWDVKGKLRDVDFTIQHPHRWYIATLYQMSNFLKHKTELWLLNGDRDLGFHRQANVTIYTKYLVVWVHCPDGYMCEPPLQLTMWDYAGWWVMFALLVTLNIITCSITYHIKIKNIELKQKRCCSINDSTTQLHDPQFSPESTPRILRKNSIISTSLESTPNITRRTNIKTSPEFSQKSLVRSPDISYKSNKKISSPKANPKISINPDSPIPSCSPKPFPIPIQDPSKKPSPIQPIPLIPSPLQLIPSPIQPLSIGSSPRSMESSPSPNTVIERIPNSIQVGSKEFLQANSYDHIKSNSSQYVQDTKISPSVLKGFETLV